MASATPTQIWHDRVGSVLRRADFVECPTVVGVFRNKIRSLRMAVHVDDILATGSTTELQWLEAVMRSEYQISAQVIGPGCTRSGKFLKRTITWDTTGIIWEADPKHAQEIFTKWRSEKPRRIDVPVTNEANHPSTGDPLSREAARNFRSAAARVQYLSHDRADLGLATCILASKMAEPRQSDLKLLRRVGDYLYSHPTARLNFKWNSSQKRCLTVFTDSDWANAEDTRRSKSGGALLYRGHTILTYCRIQECIALSSGEAELKAICRGMAEALGIRQVLEFLQGCECPIEHFTDSAAAFGIVKRKGAGAIKHLSVRQLWTQEVFRQPSTSTEQLPRVHNPSDMLCSVSSVESLNRHLRNLGFDAPAVAIASEGG